ncbi:MAG: T9SS type A sorting domain-containing protein [Ferruginibacter sp.]
MNGLSNENNASFVVTPNPVSGKQFKMVNQTGLIGKAFYCIYDLNGRKIQTGTVNLSDANQLLIINLSSKFKNGNYTINLIFNGLESFTSLFFC